MRWNARESIQYQEAKEYIDTILIPIVPVSFEKPQEAGNDHEFIQLIADGIESQFKGRILLLPPLTYFNNNRYEHKRNLLAYWLEELNVEDVKHIYFLTTDHNWKRLIEGENIEVLWIPSIPLQHLDSSHKKSIIDHQLNQIWPEIITKWQKAAAVE